MNSGGLYALDIYLFKSVNGLSGKWPLDWLAIFAERNSILKGGVFMAAYWWFWFLPGQAKTRHAKIISALAGTVIALVAARTLASTIPFRIRPLYSPGLDYHPPHMPEGAHGPTLENWSSFPSDQATMFFGLAYGLWNLSRSIGIAAFAFAAIWVCLVRVYLGIHYPSDVIAGGALGVVCVHLALRSWGGRMEAFVWELELKVPQAFYALMFLATFEMAVLFDDVREFMHGSLKVLRMLGLK